ncbi:MAG: hypothetical protein FD165_2556 [Gammaproteobacteria bacterium]|nr:MAG: hypothetical protein FD165_2556 [Gammaproteobacteria bacterium]TND02967.1 MAG: hypothetical protein FD120_2036 [Gammaproteobacteria bacterium]
MAWKFDNPLYSLSDEEQNKRAITLWEAERHGDLWAANNRVPFPVTLLIALIVLTAFMMTMPIWGQRPTAELYAPMVQMMDSPQVKGMATNKEKIAYLTTEAMKAHEQAKDSRLPGLLERHPITWSDLQLMAPAIREIQSSGGTYGLESYTVVGDQVVLANFEGMRRPDGKRLRTQPWFDTGFIIDMFYVSYFIIVMVLVCKRLPHFSQKANPKKS